MIDTAQQLLYPRMHFDEPTYSQRMVALITPPSPITSKRLPQSDDVQPPHPYTEVDNASDAMDELFQLVSATIPTNVPIILRCNLPTWQSEEASSTFYGLDLHDLRALHAKSLVFVHAFIDRLKNAGYYASYKLTISAATSCTLVRVTSGDPYATMPQKELDRICVRLKEKVSKLVQRDRMYITTLCDIPAIVIS